MGSPRYGACAAAAQRRTAESIADLRQIVSRVNPTELRDKRLQRLQQPPSCAIRALALNLLLGKFITRMTPFQALSEQSVFW